MALDDLFRRVNEEAAAEAAEQERRLTQALSAHAASMNKVSSDRSWPIVHDEVRTVLNSGDPNRIAAFRSHMSGVLPPDVLSVLDSRQSYLQGERGRVNQERENARLMEQARRREAEEKKAREVAAKYYVSPTEIARQAAEQRLKKDIELERQKQRRKIDEQIARRPERQRRAEQMVLKWFQLVATIPNINQQDTYGKTLAHHIFELVDQNFSEVGDFDERTLIPIRKKQCEALLARNPDILILDNGGNTALDIARSRAQYTIGFGRLNYGEREILHRFEKYCVFKQQNLNFFQRFGYFISVIRYLVASVSLYIFTGW